MSTTAAAGERRPLAVLGISPSNSFYHRPGVLPAILSEALELAAEVFVLCPGQPAQHTYVAVGAREGKVLSEERKLIRGIRCAPAFDARRVHILDWPADVAAHPEFAPTLARIEALVAANAGLAETAKEATAAAALSLAKAHRRVPPETTLADLLENKLGPTNGIDLARASRYLLEELACFELMPAIMAARARSPDIAEQLRTGQLTVPLLYCRPWPIFTSLCTGEFDGVCRPMFVRVLQSALDPTLEGVEDAVVEGPGGEAERQREEPQVGRSVEKSTTSSSAGPATGSRSPRPTRRGIHRLTLVDADAGEVPLALAADGEAGAAEAVQATLSTLLRRPPGSFWLRDPASGACVVATPAALAAFVRLEVVPVTSDAVAGSGVAGMAESSPDASPAAANALITCAQGFWAARVLQVACETRLFDLLSTAAATAADAADGHLDGGWVPLSRLVADLGWTGNSTGRGHVEFFRVLQTHNLVQMKRQAAAAEQLDEQLDATNWQLRLTATSRKYMLRSSPYYVGAYIAMCGSRLHGIWGRLPEALATGRSQNEFASAAAAEEGAGPPPPEQPAQAEASAPSAGADESQPKTQAAIFEQLCADPEQAQFICEAMQGGSVAVAEELCGPDAPAELNLGASQVLVDVGGGNGTFTGLLLQRYQHLHAWVLDLQHARRPADAVAARLGVANRQHFCLCDFATAAHGQLLRVLPRRVVHVQHLVVLGHILHGLGHRERRALLANIEASLQPGGRLLIYEMFTTDAAGQPTRHGLLSSINMLLDSQEGAELSVPACCQLLRELGFVRVVPLALRHVPAYTCILATKAA